MPVVTLDWPATFPRYFLDDGYTEAFVPFTEMNENVYPPVVRQLRVSTIYRVSGSLWMTSIQYAQFKLWYITGCRGQLLPFNASFVGYPAVYRFRADPEGAAQPGGDWVVSTQMIRDDS